MTYQYRGIFDSSVEDTYYAVKSLKLLGVEVPGPEETITFLKSVQREDGRYPSLTAAYYAIKGLAEFGELPDNLNDAIDYLISKLEKVTERGENFLGPENSMKNIECTGPEIEGGVLKSWDLTDKLYAIEVPSKLSDIFMIIDALDTLGCGVKDERSLMDVIFLHKLQDGGFGNRYSSIDETFYAVAILRMLDYDIAKLNDTAAWIIKCEDPSGGFRARPSIMRAYLMEHLYYGIKSMEVLGLKPKHGRRHIEFIEKCANVDGGFRNSLHGGLSSLETTFYAIFSSISLLKS